MSYWNWDPKETWVFITKTIFAIYLRNLKEKKKIGLSLMRAILEMARIAMEQSLKT
ncbi:cytochrome C assembly protein [Medicago truncatula]|uniref:Cytochrome C assembly protein n=1 Tax=Medicago truncatula TaxID=3880 RepID=G7JMF8_MEDTR|nr:cytochrome C assembly protein [Medicago truncatula]